MSAVDCCSTLLPSGEGQHNHAHGHDVSQDNTDGDSIMLLEPRPFRPFKTSEEYLYAMREDLAEWINSLYNLDINVDNFFEILDTGEVLCGHANNVRRLAEEQRHEQQEEHLQGHGGVTPGRKFSTKWDIPSYDVVYRSDVTPGSFFARDNVHNFIHWCRDLGIMEVLLFETDDLVLRKNEKHVILSLLEVARRGARFGMSAPLLVQMEADIDREMEQERLAEERMAESGGQFDEDEAWANGAHDLTPPEPPKVFYGPKTQIITNDLKSLDEMVRDLVERCSCPSQFPMVKVSEGKYRIGDTKVLIFVRILRNHVMVRVGGGWDTLEHYLDKHDPCRCRQGHRVAMGSRVGFKTSTSGQDRQLMNVTYDSKRSSGGHTLSLHTTTIRLTQQEALEEGKHMIEEGLASRKKSLSNSEALRKKLTRTEFTVEVIPVTHRKSSEVTGCVDGTSMSHSEIEKEVHTSLLKIESDELSPLRNAEKSTGVKLRRKSVPSKALDTNTSQNRRKSTSFNEGVNNVSQKSTTLKESPKKLIKSRSSVSLLSDSVNCPKPDKSPSKKDTAVSRSPTAAEISRERSRSLGQNGHKSSQQAALPTHRNSESPQNSHSSLNTSLDSNHRWKRLTSAASLKSSKASVQAKEGNSSRIENKSKITIHHHKFPIRSEGIATPSSRHKGARVSKAILTPKSRSGSLSQGVLSDKDTSGLDKMPQRSKSDASLNVAAVRGLASTDRSISQTSSKRLLELSSPRKTLVHSSVNRELSKTSPRRKPSKSVSKSQSSLRELFRNEDDPKVHRALSDKHPLPLGKNLPKSKIPVLSMTGTPIKHQHVHKQRLLNQSGKTLPDREKHSYSQLPVLKQKLEKTLSDQIDGKVEENQCITETHLDMNLEHGSEVDNRSIGFDDDDDDDESITVDEKSL